ncbi:MAG: transglutaminase family protein [Chitinophagaceae bacterium]
MPRFNIHHVTKYTYEAPVKDSANQIILFPVKDEFQEVLKHDLVITGEPGVEIYKDYYGNEIGSFTTIAPHKELSIDSTIEVITKPRPEPSDLTAKEEQWKHLETICGQVAFLDFLKVEYFDTLPEIISLMEEEKNGEITPLQAASRLNTKVYEHFRYIKGITNVETTLDEIWKLKAGVCQDFAHILSAMLRIIKIPARYVSGYVCPNEHGLRGEGATHAWVEAYIPFNGWIGFDPTNNMLVNDLHVRLAVGRNFRDCSPVKGTYKGTSNQVLEVGVTVGYEDGHSTVKDLASTLTPQPSPKETKNSYRQFVEMQQQQ